jgi:hypothetical protein
MRPAPYQAVLFETEEPAPDHLHYVTTNSVAVKPGMTRTTIDKRMKRDGQFKGHKLIRAWPADADCKVHRIDGRVKCDWEIRWENAFANDRLPGSEQYRAWSAYIQQACRFVAGSELKAQAVVDWMISNCMDRTA